MTVSPYSMTFLELLSDSSGVLKPSDPSDSSSSLYHVELALHRGNLSDGGFPDARIAAAAADVTAAAAAAVYACSANFLLSMLLLDASPNGSSFPAGLFAVVGAMPETLHGGCFGCGGKLPVGDTRWVVATCRSASAKCLLGDTSCGVGDAPYSPAGKIPCCDTHCGASSVELVLVTISLTLPNLLALFGHSSPGEIRLGPQPGGGAEGIGVEGSVTCGEFLMPCKPKWLLSPPREGSLAWWLAAGAAGRGLGGSHVVP